MEVKKEMKKTKKSKGEKKRYKKIWGKHKQSKGEILTGKEQSQLFWKHEQSSLEHIALNSLHDSCGYVGFNPSFINSGLGIVT